MADYSFGEWFDDLGKGMIFLLILPAIAILAGMMLGAYAHITIPKIVAFLCVIAISMFAYKMFVDLLEPGTSVARNYSLILVCAVVATYIINCTA